MEIRSAKLEDAKEIASLIASLEAFSRMEELSEDELYKRTLDMLEPSQNNPNYLVFVAINPNLVGYLVLHIMPNILYSGNDSFVSELFVSKTARGQKIGSKLLKYAVEQAKNRDCFRVQLLNIKSREAYKRQFYKKQAWQERTAAAVFSYDLRK